MWCTAEAEIQIKVTNKWKVPQDANGVNQNLALFADPSRNVIASSRYFANGARLDQLPDNQRTRHSRRCARERRGFYKRRRGILEHLENGRIGLIDLAIHDYLNLKANLVIDPACSIPPGVCFSSAVAIHAICSKGATERTIRRSLAHLEKIGWIKRWIPRGEAGNYPILVCRSSVHDLSGVEYRVNGAETMDWRHPVLESAAVCPQSVREVSGNREERVKNREKRKPAAKPTRPADPRRQPFVDFAYQAFTTKHGQKPSWAGKDWKGLAVLLAASPASLEELKIRWTSFLASTELFTVRQGGSLAYFCAHIDAFLSGPLLVERAKGGNGAKPSISDNAAVTLASHARQERVN